jgi:hypothetical protein
VITNPVRRPLSTHRARGLALAGSTFALLCMFALQLAESNRSTWRAVLQPGPATGDQALAAVCGSLALALGLWLLGALALCVGAALVSESSALGSALVGCARLIAPRILRNAIAALLGVAIAATPAVANAGSPRPDSSSSPRLSSDQALSPAWAVGSGPAASTPQADLLPSWAPEHPGTLDHPGSSDSPRTASPSPTGPASLGAQSRRSGSPAARVKEPTPVVTPPRRTTSDHDEIVVRRGDTLWSLAERHLGPGTTDGEIAVEWPHWFTANRDVIGNDPDHLVPGERLRPPDPHQRSTGPGRLSRSSGPTRSAADTTTDVHDSSTSRPQVDAGAQARGTR